MSVSSRTARSLLAGVAALALASCGGADDVASPGAGAIDVIVNPPAATPTPTPSATPTPLTAAQFALATAVNGVTVTADEQLAIVNAGTNNNINGAGQVNGVYPTSATSLTPAGNPTTLGSFFTATNYVGALNGPNDTAFQGWTCNSTSAQFGGNGAACTSVPAVASGGPGTCPTGTIDDGVSGTAFRYCRLPQVITTSLTLPRIAGVVYRFRGQTEVGVDVGTTGADSGVTLTIAPGVALAADASETSNDVLLVNRGSRISAVGTADQPIIFTSQQNLATNGVSDATQGRI